MIKIFSQNKIVKEILTKAFIRSHGKIKSNKQREIYCFISPDEKDQISIQNFLTNEKSKILIFGKISNELAKSIGLNHNNKINI